MLTTWRVHWLLHVRPGKKTASNDYEAESHSNGPVNRCEDEYFKKSKTYIPLNKQNNHWITVVMHSGKREFQVLDSLMTGKLDTVTRELVEDLRKQLAEDIQEANATGIVNYPDVSKWPIQTYDMPKQHDGNSCGIFLLRCFQYWDGDKWTGLFSQTSIDDSRELMIAQLIFSERNKLDEVKNKVIRISKKKK
ncbi:sentrin-specific protease [Triticum aestivum]|uniref:sentrin-specific protease n=1 Tax=Triticum aestivum TaxID=4565 RepID=UPI001D02ED4F|nr:sentrin-specific protease-like [Triticum aestivum]